jgi:hypothetical protein
MELQSIRFTKDDLREPLPPICIVTGEDTEETIRQKFSYTPGWVYFLLLLNWLVCLIVALVTTKKMTVTVPIVDDQRNYFRTRALIQAWIVVSSILSLIGCSIAAVVVLEDNIPVAIALAVFGVVSFILLLVVSSLYVKNGVHVAEITESSIRFNKAHPRFIDAVLQDREELELERREWRAKRRAEREAAEPPPTSANAEDRDEYYRKRHTDREGD